ncbi:MAG TPA: monovalent cation/H+ antiporter complex subunit F [Draconibacterium sp.]|jgi:multicomponent Na+:H+ antiporter subunit F|nr:monovalent cation/H+ antiporter complex subunit F [Draconibacterium sp.]
MTEIVPNIVLYIAFAFLMTAMIITLVRLLKGPSINDRIAAMDLIASIIMGVILVYSVLINNAMYFDVPLVISLISFIGTIAVSTYLKQKNG